MNFLTSLFRRVFPKNASPTSESNKELSCLAKGLIKSVTEDASRWEVNVNVYPSLESREPVCASIGLVSDNWLDLRIGGQDVSSQLTRADIAALIALVKSVSGPVAAAQTSKAAIQKEQDLAHFVNLGCPPSP